MSTDRDILTLTQWLSPAYPVGAFAYSHGLEAAVQAGALTCGEDLTEWLTDVVLHGSGRNDCVLLRAAYTAKDQAELVLVNATGLAMAASSERQLETKLQGDAFCQTTASIWGGEDAAYIYPVALGAVAAHRKIDVSLTAALYLQAMITNLVSAAQRLIALGQTDGQKIVSSFAPLCEEIADDTKAGTLDDLHSTAFLSDIASMRHEAMQPRIFRS